MNIIMITMTEPLFGAYLEADIEEVEGIAGYMYVKGFNQIIVSEFRYIVKIKVKLGSSGYTNNTGRLFCFDVKRVTSLMIHIAGSQPLLS